VNDVTRGERTLSTYQEITPIAVRSWTLNGLSERLIVSHYENNCGAAVRTLNAVRSELAVLDAGTPGYRIRALKREELIAMGSVVLHELYFGNLGGEDNKVPDAAATMQAEIQEKRQWVSKERFVEGLALVNALPGPAAAQWAPADSVR